MRLKNLLNVTRMVGLILPLLFMTGCTKSTYQIVEECNKKQPSYLMNVPAKDPTAIDGTWFNPKVGKKYSLTGGRMWTVWRFTNQMPPFPSVLVRDIERVAPGRYRGILIPTKPQWKGTVVTYSIIGKDKLLSRWHYPSGKIQNLVYDRVKLANAQWFLKEYEAFLKESQTGAVGSQTGGTQTRHLPEDSAGQTKDVSPRTPIVAYKMYTKPGRISPGTRFDLIIEYAVTDPAVQTKRIPVTFILEILKSKNTAPASNLKKPVFPTPDNTDKVHSFKAVTIDCPNGKRTSRIVHLSATKDKGTYYMVVYLKYEHWTKKLSMHLPIY